MDEAQKLRKELMKIQGEKEHLEHQLEMKALYHFT